MAIPGTLTASGRQAIALVARHLRDAGVREVLVPRVSCPTMVVPFELEGMRTRVVGCGPEGLLDAAALEAALAVCDRAPAVLHAETFGNRAGPDLRAGLAGARSDGTTVVVDVTHSLLGRLPDLAVPEADLVVASLRKLLPLPLGGVVTGLANPAGSLGDADPDVAAVALAMERHPEVPALGDALEDLLDADWVPARMPPALVARLECLDPGIYAQARTRRLVDLHRALAPYAPVNPGAPWFPVLRHERAQEMRQALADAGIPPPLHWPGVTDDLVVVPDDPRAVDIIRGAIPVEG